MSSLPPNPSPEELLTALLGGQLSGEEKERAEALAASGYQEFWEGLVEQKELLRELPRFQLPDSFADQTVKAILDRSSKPAPSVSARPQPVLGRWESRAAIGAVVGLAALILCLLVVMPPIESPSLGLVQSDANQESGLADNKGTIESSGNEGSGNGMVAGSGSGVEQGTAPQARMASIQNQAMPSVEIWLLDVVVRDGMNSIGDALTRHGVEWSANEGNAVGQSQPYQALLVRTTALRLKQALAELANDQSVTNVWKIPASGIASSQGNQGEGNQGEPLPMQKLEYQFGGAGQSEAEQRRQIRALNDWFGLDPELVDEARDLKQQTYLLMLRVETPR